MGLFDKQKCVMCGKEGRLLNCYDSNEGEKNLCSDCERKMHVSGFTSVCLNHHKKITFEDLLNYQKFYFDTTESLKNNRKYVIPGVAGIAHNMDDIVFNSDLICFPEYEDFMIPSDDVYAVVYVDLPKYSSTFTDAFMIVLFTKNPVIPYYSIIKAGKVKFFSLSTKSKDFRESIFSSFEMELKGLKYPVGKARDIRKMVKKDSAYDLPVDRKDFLDWLLDVEVTMGKFKPKHAEREIPANNWATSFFHSNDIIA